MGVVYNSSIVTDGLVLCLDAANRRSYPGAGTTWTDLSGNGNNGTLTNGPTFSAANGGSVVFDGVDDYVTTASTNIIANLSTCSIMMWVARTGVTVDYCGILSWGSNSGLGNSRFGFLAGGTAYGSNQDVLLMAANGANTFGYTTTKPLATLYKFAYICLVYNGSGATNATKLLCYVNGIKETLTFNGTIPTLTPNTSYPFYVCREQVYYGSYNLSNIQVYNRALSPQEILQNYNATKGRYL